jgi:endonuclease/exonuclease/phosphatase family metal-dependent hydrolase
MHTLIPTRPIALALGLALLLGVGSTRADNTPKKPKNEKKNVEVANLNILHGINCDPPLPAHGDQCRVRDRIDLLVEHLVAAGCPDIVTLQENVTSEFAQRTATGEIVGPLDDTTALIKARLPDLAEACGFTYQVVFDPAAVWPPASGRGIDEELILTRFPVSQFEVMPLYGPLYTTPVALFFRHVLYARIEHPEGPVDVFTTHLASDSDFALFACGSPPPFPLPPPLVSPACPAECVAFEDTVRECQAKQMALFIASRHDVPEPAVISGDFNAEPGSSEYLEFADRRWRDSHLAAGNPECNPATGVGCTTGRVDTNLSDLESAALNVNKRTDFIFVVPPEEGSRCSGLIQTFHHPRRPVTTTGIFAGEPNPFAPACGASPLPICWASDHSGNQLNLACRR